MRPVLAAAISLSVFACVAKETPGTTDSTAPAAASMSAAADPAVVRQAIDSANAHFVAAMVNGDTAAMIANYADDAVVLGAGEKAARGRDAIVKSMGAVRETKVSAFALKTEDVIVSGEYAIETGAYDMTMRPKASAAMHDVGKYIVVWQHQPDGSWKIIRDIWNSDGPAK